MGASSAAGDSKAYWQKQIDDLQGVINRLKSENARDRETVKNNNSVRGNKYARDDYKKRIEQRTKEIKNKQEMLKGLRESKARASNK